MNSVCLLNVDGRYFCAIFQNVSNLGPATDFYKKLALDCSAQQVAVDLMMLNGQYADISSICKYTYCKSYE